MKKIFLFITFILVILFILGVSFLLLYQKRPQITVGGKQTFFIAVAQTPQEQEIGLSKYKTLPQDRAMYFPFAKPDYYSFWMKGMHFPIDILFIRNGFIVSIFTSVPAPTAGQVTLPTYQPNQPADAVLEINAGLSNKYGFTVGDEIKLSN